MLNGNGDKYLLVGYHYAHVMFVTEYFSISPW